MARERKKAVRGCIKTSKGPWLVRRTTEDGREVTTYRFPSDMERNKNKEREKRRRTVAKKIFAGLKAHGNYNLPKHADHNDILMALCKEAGWHVEDDGRIFRKQKAAEMTRLVDTDSRDGVDGEDGITLTLSL